MDDFYDHLLLGKKTAYGSEYNPELLCPVPRKHKRDELGLPEKLPFFGVDIWNAYEISWLNTKGKPVVALGEFHVPCETPCLVESKSLKLYLNSLNQSHFESFEVVKHIIHRDLSNACGAKVPVWLFSIDDPRVSNLSTLPGLCLDDLDIEIKEYIPKPQLLEGVFDAEHQVHETLHSHLLKSNCLVTGQPDWGSILVDYFGSKIDHAALLRYLISYREHNEFHEHCVERVYYDLLRFCRPQKLAVYARYTRRGGLDINPYRSNFKCEIKNYRLVRQ
jgi:7-cyano-7-deazaguanine reductase